MRQPHDVGCRSQQSGTSDTQAPTRSGAAIPTARSSPKSPGSVPGRVLDVGCDEGADAVWLSRHGWDVTALDVSQVALDRARFHAANAGAPVLWVHGGLLDVELPESGFDLVSAQYPALRQSAGNHAERALMNAVAPGGALLVVGHDTSDRAAAMAHGFDPDEWVGPREVAALLDGTWTVDVYELRRRTVTGGAGAHHTHDVVLSARRNR